MYKTSPKRSTLLQKLIEIINFKLAVVKNSHFPQYESDEYKSKIGKPMIFMVGERHIEPNKKHVYEKNSNRSEDNNITHESVIIIVVFSSSTFVHIL